MELYHARYINEFVRLKTAPALLPLFPNGREITESMAAFTCVRNEIMPHAGFQFGDKNVKVLVIGDGKRPRTGALFATRSNWDVASIDPVIRLKSYPFRRLSLYQCKYESLHWDTRDYAHTLLVFVHSHADLGQALMHTQANRLHIVGIPCCVSMDLPSLPPNVAYLDGSIWSPAHRVLCWIDFPLKEQNPARITKNFSTPIACPEVHP